MDGTNEKNKEGPDTGGILQDDDEMDIDAQMAQAARPTHKRFMSVQTIVTPLVQSLGHS